MALIQCDFFAESLGLSTSMYVILPQETQGQIGMKGATGGRKRFPVLYLLHGMSDDHTIWLRRTSIERYVAPLGIAVVMPAVARSCYCDMAHGLKYWTFVSEELPALAQSFFPISDKREDNFVAGLSMGGFGAFKLAFNKPGKFAAAASLSGAMDMEEMVKRMKGRENENESIFGDIRKIKGSMNDLFAMSRRLAKSKGPKPKLFMACGKEDFLYQDNQKMKRHLEMKCCRFCGQVHKVVADSLRRPQTARREEDEEALRGRVQGEGGAGGARRGKHGQRAGVEAWSASEHDP